MESFLHDKVIVQCQVSVLFLIGGWLIALFPGLESWMIILVLTYFVA